MQINPTTLYNNVPAMQHPDTFAVFAEFFNENKFHHVIEIGTAYGGLALFMHEQSKLHGFTFRTYDITPLVPPPPFDQRIGSCFDAPHEQDIINTLMDGKCLLLCDGGNKAREVRYFARYMNFNSVIMAHDYASTPEYFREHIAGKVWDWHEIMDIDIPFGTVHLHPKWYSRFANVAWFCGLTEGRVDY
jgi:hypothetical protein